MRVLRVFFHEDLGVCNGLIPITLACIDLGPQFQCLVCICALFYESIHIIERAVGLVQDKMNSGLGEPGKGIIDRCIEPQCFLPVTPVFCIPGEHQG